MSRAESDEDLEQMQTDFDSESDVSDCSLDEDYIPRGAHAGNCTDEDTSDEDWNSTPRKRRASRTGSSSASRSPASSPLKSPWGKGTQSPLKRRLSNSSTPKKDASSLNSGGTISTPSRKTLSGKRQLLKEGDEDDGDRWHNIDEEDVEPTQPKFRPQRDVGPQLNRTGNYTPLDLFQLFFSREVIDTLVKNTNIYGKNKQRGEKQSWTPVTAADMYSFIALILYMGIVPLKKMRDYWRCSQLFNLPFPASIMPSRRFFMILGSLHMNDPDVEAANDEKKGTPGYDRLCKIKPLYEQILGACHTFFHPNQHISIDERMVASKARIAFKQYIKNKPTRWGYKLFVLADSECAYTLNFFIYTGRDSKPSGKGNSYDIVMRLLGVPHLGKGYKLYVDNFYTSPRLFSDLLQKRIWACGTLRTNVAGYPRNKKNDIASKAPRGTLRWIRKEKLLFVKWLDSREVTMCSTMHKAYNNDVTKRNMKDTDGKWAVKEVPIPACIKDYNKYMGGVDLSDALIAYYNVLHRTNKWYKTFFYHFVDIATVNAFILHKEMCKMQQRPILPQKDFREQLILSLTEIGSSPNRSAPQNFVYLPPQESLRSKSSAEPPTSDSPEPCCSGHLPVYFTEHMSNVDSRYRGTLGRRACVLCKRKSPIYCKTCLKTLCLNTSRNCYNEWHRKNKICA